MFFFCRLRALSDQGYYLTVKKGQSKNKVKTGRAVKEVTSTLDSLIQSHIMSSKAETCNSRDEKNILKNKEDCPSLPNTFAMVNDQSKFQPDTLAQVLEGQDASPHNILGPSTMNIRRKTEVERIVCHQSQFVNLYDKNRLQKDEILTTDDEFVGR